MLSRKAGWNHGKEVLRWRRTDGRGEGGEGGENGEIVCGKGLAGFGVADDA